MSLTRRAFAGAMAGGAAAAAQKKAPPNIVFILADDLGCYDLGSYGQKLIRTPNIDKLAAEGMRFRQAYAGATVCAPSRCALMTGLHTGHGTVRANHSVRTKQRVPLKATDYTVARLLKENGYRTGIFGKWGLGEPDTAGIPTRQGFDDWLGFLNQDHAVDYYTDYLWRNEKKETIEGNRNGAKQVYVHDLFTREALRFVEENRKRPFFLYLPYTTPHEDLVIPSDEPYSGQPWSQEAKNYAAMVTRMDRDVGRLMDRIKTLGLEDNTLVFFSSDNGAKLDKERTPLFRSTGALRGGKGEVYEGGIRAPMIARWKGRIREGVTSDHVWAFWDFLPTAAAIAGVKAPSGLDGRSVAGVLSGGKANAEERPLYWEEPLRKGFQQALRLGDWKIVRKGLKGPVELYNLREDEGERHDVAAANPQVVRRLEGILHTSRTENPDYPAQS